MIKAKRSILLFLMTIVALSCAMAQGVTTQGKEFWLTYMQNGYRDHPDGQWVTTQVLVSAKRSCTGIVSNPRTGWSQSFSVAADAITTIDIPEYQGYHGIDDNEVITNKAIRIIASDTVSVYCTNIANVSFDASFVLPIESLGSEYIIITYEQSTLGQSVGNDSYVYENETSAFVVVATENNTQVSITPSKNTLGGHPSGTPFMVNLNAGQTYQVRSTNSGSNRNLSGSRVVAADGKKIAVFNGNTLTSVPTSMTNGYDHIFEQALPVESWGKEFCITNSKEREHDFITIMSGSDDNVITKNGNYLVTLQAGSSTCILMDTTAYIQTSEPTAIYLYNTSSWDDGSSDFGDPSMVWIAPMEQRIEDVTFTTFDHPEANITFHCVNIVAKTTDINHVYYDNSLISASEFTAIVGSNGQYSYTQKIISHGVHNLHCSGGVTAHVYGFGTSKGYAYMAGSTANPLTSQLIIENTPTSHLPHGYDACQEEIVHFGLQLNYDMSEANWSFGDGTTGTGMQVNHAYSRSGDYIVSCDVYQQEYGQNTLVTTLTGVVHVYTSYIETENHETCGSYIWNGHTYSESGQYIYQGQTIYGCDSTAILNLTITPGYTTNLTMETCDDYIWYGQICTESGLYQHHLQSSMGCDSLVILQLTIGSSFSSEESVTACNNYTWRGNTYTESGIYTDFVSNPDSCDSTFVLNLYLGLDTTSDTVAMTCEPFRWYGQLCNQSGDYWHLLQTTLGCDSLVTLHYTIGDMLLHPIEVKEICDASFTWFGQTYTENGVYYDTITDAGECDNVYVLQLILNETYYREIEAIVCDKYQWSLAPNGYIIESGEYVYNLQSQEGCDSIISLNLTVNQTPDISLEGPDIVAVATNLTTGIYYYYVADSASIEPNTMEWLCSNPDWSIMPLGDGYRCRLLVTTLGEGVLKAITHNSTGCDTSVDKDIIATFYNVDENNVADIKLFPNPVHDNLTIESQDMIEKIEIFDHIGNKIYNNKNCGIKIDIYTSKFAAGTYIIQLTTKSDVLNRKFVKR